MNMLMRTMLLPMAALALWGLSMGAQAGPISSCDGATPRTCSLFETDASGNFSEVSSPITIPANDWFFGDYLIVEGPSGDELGGTPSDIVRFFATVGADFGFGNTATLYSNGSVEFAALLAGHTGTNGDLVNFSDILTEGPGPFEEAVITQVNGDQIHVFSGTPQEVPVPATLLLLGAGLAGFGLMRRKAAA
jgi:hypothetical protein